MNKLVLLLACIFLSIQISSAQGTVRGKITDESGEALIGVGIALITDTTVGATTDFDGNFSIDLPRDTASIIVDYTGFEKIVELFDFKNEKIILRDYILKVPTTLLNEVVVTAKATKANDYFLENIKKKSAVSLDYVSAESMKKIGDSNITAAVSRVSGVSTNGSFITVRGIGDRYVQTAINGAQIPTLDPFTNNIKLDIIPSSLVDNVIISKTASPDLPGDWTGAYISVETKDYPEKFTLNVESQVGYNENVSFKPVLTNATSSTDWLGYDNGYRDYKHEEFSNYKSQLSNYDIFMSLGLQDYYKGFGVTKDWTYFQPQVSGTLDRLGFVELGILPKAKFDDPASIAEAELKFRTGGYREKAFEIFNRNASEANKKFANNWTTFQKENTTNQSHSFSIGNQTKIFGKQFGYIVGLKYSTNVQYDPEIELNKTESSIFNNGTEPSIVESGIHKIARYTNGWNGLINVAYKFNTFHNISAMYMSNTIGINSLREGTTIVTGSSDPFILSSSQFYESRVQSIYQFKTDNYFPKKKIKLESNFTYTKGNSKAPDFKRFRFFEIDSTSYYYHRPSFADDPLSRDFRYLNENLLDAKFSIEIPIGKNNSMKRKIKTGASFKSLTRKYDQYNYELVFDKGSPYAYNKDLVDFFDERHFAISSGKNADYAYDERNNDPNHTKGYSNVLGLFAMADYQINNKLRVTGGIRGENIDLYVDALKYDSLNLPRNDLRRIYEGALISNPGVLRKWSLLPSINTIYRFNNDENNPIQLRMSYGRTLARPSLREYTESIAYDFELRTEVFGNSTLKMVDVDNFDIRMETYFKSGDNLTLSAFYKNFNNHIELIYLNGGFSWSNSNNSFVKGVEIEGRKKIGKYFELNANVSLVNSKSNVVGYTLLLNVPTRTQVWFPIDTFSRVMFGQAPFVINGLITYKADKIGLNASIGYNVQAKRLVIQGTRYPSDQTLAVPNVYEMPRHLLDFKISKNLFKRFNLSITIKDILNAPIRRSYSYIDASDEEVDYYLDFDKQTYGTNYLMSLSYKI
jgi:hypothetical protein